MMKISRPTDSMSPESAMDIGRLTVLVVIALLSPFIVIFQNPSQAWNPADRVAGLFSSVLWASAIISDPQASIEQMTFVLLPVMTYPVLLLIAIIRIWFAISIVGYRRGMMRVAGAVVSGSLMFVLTMMICISVTFNTALLGLPWGGLISIPSSELVSSACYPFPLLYLVGLIFCSRKHIYGMASQS